LEYDGLRLRYNFLTNLLMVYLPTYTSAGSWDQVAGHQANLFGKPVSVAHAIEWYIDNGLSPSKIVVGMPLYGRSFANTEGPGKPFQDVGPGSWERGVYDYRALPLPGAYMFRDEQAGASWSYDYKSKEMVSFDSEEVGRWKGDWIKKKGLRGSMFWELSGDKETKGRDGMEGGLGKVEAPGRSLVRVVKEAMGGNLDQGPNWLTYGSSKFQNMRKGMQ
jgi:chitinase